MFSTTNEKDNDAVYYKNMYEKMSDINSNMNESIKLYHEQFALDQAEIKLLRKRILLLEEEISNLKGNNI